MARDGMKQTYFEKMTAGLKEHCRIIKNFELNFLKEQLAMAKGSDLVKILLPSAQRNDDYVFGAEVPKDDPDWSGPWDCAEFIAWGIYQASGRLYGCENNEGNPHYANAYTGFFDRDAENLGKKISINEAARIAGAVLLRAPGYHGIKTGHVVVSDGKGGTIEAAGTKDGVIQSHISGRPWSTGILIPWIEYTETTPEVVVVPPIPAPGFTRLVFLDHPNMQGDDIRMIQAALKKKGFQIDVDGVWGEHSADVLIEFQKQVGTIADGIVGPKTWALLTT